MSQENLTFKINLNGTYWGKRPQYSIWLDENVVRQSEITQEPHIIEFQRGLSAGEHHLKIRLENKEDSDTKVVDGKIVKDLLLNINDIQIDGVSLGNLLRTADYILDKPQEYNGTTITQLNNCVNLGWNGTYILKFSIPFYVWLLENL